MKSVLIASFVFSTFVAAPALAVVAAPSPTFTVIPVSAVGSSAFNGFGAANAIDQGGNAASTDWASNSQGVGSFLNLDLGQVVTLTGFSLVDRVTSGGNNGSFAGGTTDFTTQFSLQGFTDASFTLASGAAQLFSKPTPTTPTNFESFAFSGALANFQSTQFVRYTVVASNGANAGLSDISFSATGAVPEPASWAMLIAGFGLVGATARRRRQTVVLA